MSSQQTASATFKGDTRCPSFCARGVLSARNTFKIFSCYHKISGKRLHVEGVRRDLRPGSWERNRMCQCPSYIIDNPPYCVREAIVLVRFKIFLKGLKINISLISRNHAFPASPCHHFNSKIITILSLHLLIISFPSPSIPSIGSDSDTLG